MCSAVLKTGGGYDIGRVRSIWVSQLIADVVVIKRLTEAEEPGCGQTCRQDELPSATEVMWWHSETTARCRDALAHFTISRLRQPGTALCGRQAFDMTQAVA